ncbi:MAG TPA: hypothetical protein VFX02_07370, partial [Gammaproteobacteria bacterium]|nr:hypothetical protein [Gammaproteobacteria bacterium]
MIAGRSFVADGTFITNRALGTGIADRALVPDGAFVASRTFITGRALETHIAGQTLVTCGTFVS